jgi:hypothetical protein
LDALPLTPSHKQILESMTLEERKDNTYYDKTGILKDMSELKRYELFKGTVETKFKDLTKEGEYVRWSDVEAIINKYLNP